jgi:membrane protein DedA with SNARE-associated domain
VTLDSTLIDAIRTYGAWIVGGAIAIESMGIPVPGETMLITAAVYAGTSGKLSITHVIAAAIAGAIIGDNLGFWIGRMVGVRWVMRHQSTWPLTPRRIKVGQYLFQRHGGKVVFFGRFVALLRALAAFLAGLNGMDWRRFALFNVLGAIVWAGGYGIAAYAFGEQLTNALHEAGSVLAVVGVAVVIAAFIGMRRYERRLEDEAERALPGPLETSLPTK